jgi:hypothetical protein
MSEMFWHLYNSPRREVWQGEPCIPDLELVFEHFCIHAGGRAVLDELESNLAVTDWHMERGK